MSNVECWNIPTNLAQGDPPDGDGGSDLVAADDNMLRGAAHYGVQAALEAIGKGLILYPDANAGLVSAGTALSLNITAGRAVLEVNPIVNGCLGYVAVRWGQQNNIVPAGLVSGSTLYIVANVVIPSEYETAGVVNADSRRDATVTFTAQASSTAPNGGIIIARVVTGSGVISAVDTTYRQLAGGVANGVLTLPDILEPQTTTNKLYSLASGILKFAGKRLAQWAGTPSNSQLVKTDASGNLVTAATVGTAEIADDAVTDAKIGNRTIAVAAPAGDTGLLGVLLNGLAYMVKAITGKSDWRTAPATTLEAAKTHMDSTSNPHGVTAVQVGAPPTSRAISAGTGLSGGGDLSADRTISLPNSGVVAGTYNNPTQIVVDAQGRITSIT